MDVLVAILIAGGIISIGAHLIRRQRASTETESSVDDAFGIERQADPLRGLEQARPGDVVVHERADLIVERVVRLAEGSTIWTEYELGDGPRRLSIVLLPTDPDHALVGQRVDDLEIVGLEPPESLDHRGLIYRLERCGQARAQADASSGVDPVEHWLYQRPGDQRVWLRRTRSARVGGGEMRVYVGSRLGRHMLELIPA